MEPMSDDLPGSPIALSAEELADRRGLCGLIVTMSRHEGLEVPAETMAVLDAYVSGQISGDELQQRLAVLDDGVSPLA
jgi:hypothetical protein